MEEAEGRRLCMLFILQQEAPLQGAGVNPAQVKYPKWSMHATESARSKSRLRVSLHPRCMGPFITATTPADGAYLATWTVVPRLKLSP